MTWWQILIAVLLYGVAGWVAAGRPVPLRVWLANWAYNIHVAASQAVNSALLFGDPDESLSGRIGKAALRGARWAQWLDRLAWHHFILSVEADEGAASAATRTVRV